MWKREEIYFKQANFLIKWNLSRLGEEENIANNSTSEIFKIYFISFLKALEKNFETRRNFKKKVDAPCTKILRIRTNAITSH